MPPAGAALYFNVQAGSDAALPAGISRKRDFRVQLLDETLAPAASGVPAYLSLVDADGQNIRFSAETGAVVAMTSASGKVLLAEDYFRNVNNTYDPAGNLVSSYSAAEGLMRTRTGADGELVLEWYAPAAVTALADGTYEVTGEPYKTSSYLTTEENGVRTTVITRQQRGLPAHTITRTEEPGRVSIAKGQGDDAIIRTIETNRLYGGLSERIETVRGINDAEPVACNRSVRQYTDGGWLLVSETEAFNTPLARTTSYEYNSQYRVSRINRPDGGYTRYEYDGEGRVTLEAEPWAGGGEQVTRTEYAGLRFYDNRPARVAESRVLSDGTEIELTAAAYAYEQSPLMERVTKTVTAAGSGQDRQAWKKRMEKPPPIPMPPGKSNSPGTLPAWKPSMTMRRPRNTAPRTKRRLSPRSAANWRPDRAARRNRSLPPMTRCLLNRKASGMATTGCRSQAAPMNTTKKAAARKPRGATAASAPRPGCAAASSRKRTKTGS